MAPKIDFAYWPILLGAAMLMRTPLVVSAPSPCMLKKRHLGGIKLTKIMNSHQLERPSPVMKT